MWPFGKKKEKQERSPEQMQVQAFARKFLPEEFTLVAVTGPEGFACKREEDEVLYTAGISLTAWMEEDDGVVHTGAARLLILADERLRDYLRARLPGNFIIKARVRAAVEGDAFQLIGLPEPGFDPELKAILNQQVKPVTLETDDLGTFILNRSVDQFQQEVSWREGTALLVFDRVEEELEDCLSTARVLLADVPGWDARMRAFAARHVLAQINEKNAGDGEWSEEALCGALELDCVQVGNGGCLAFWFGGEPLWGQTVRVMGTVSGGPVDADMEE